MRNFLVNVNGTSYQISVEEIDGKARPCCRACRRSRCGSCFLARSRRCHRQRAHARQYPFGQR